MTSRGVPSIASGKRLRWDALIASVLGFYALFGATREPWLSWWLHTSEPVGARPVSFTVLDFGAWGYTYLVATVGLGALVITAIVIHEWRARRLRHVVVGAAVVGLVALLAASSQIHRYEVALRTQWSDALAGQGVTSLPLTFFTDGLVSAVVAVYALVAAGLLALLPRERAPTVLAGVLSFVLLMGIALPVRVEWIADGSGLAHHYQHVLALGDAGRRLAATAVPLAVLLAIGATGAAPRRWIGPWFVTLVVLAVLGVAAAASVFDEVVTIGSWTEGFDRHVDVDLIDAVGVPMFLALLLSPLLALRFAQLWHRRSKRSVPDRIPNPDIPPHRNTDASEGSTDEEVFHNILDFKRYFRRLIPTLILLFVLAWVLSSASLTGIGFPAPFAQLLGLAVSMAFCFVMVRLKKKQYSKASETKTLTLSPSGVVMRSGKLRVQIPWSQVDRLDFATEADALKIGAVGTFAAATMRRQEVFLIGVGKVSLDPDASVLLQAQLEQNFGGQNLGRVQTGVPLAHFDTEWADGRIGQWIQAYRPDVME